MSRLADKKKNLTVGFIPTMGSTSQRTYKVSKGVQNSVILPLFLIFVNPTQFNDKNDLQSIPRTLDKDIEILFEPSTDIVLCLKRKRDLSLWC